MSLVLKDSGIKFIEFCVDEEVIVNRLIVQQSYVLGVNPNHIIKIKKAENTVEFKETIYLVDGSVHTGKML